MNGRMLKTLSGLWLLVALLPAQAQEVYYIHTDALGSPVAETDASRNVVARFEYEPYGRRLNGSNDDKPGYTGHVMDAATGLTYAQQRYYDQTLGVFLSVDPVTAYDKGDMRFFNRYAYAFNNPYRFTDPDGRESSAIRAMERDHRAYLSGEMSEGEVVANRVARGRATAGGAAAVVVVAVAVESGAVAATLVVGAKVVKAAKKERVRVVCALIISCGKVDPAVPRDAVTGEVKRTPTSQVIRDLDRRRQNKEAPTRERRNNGEQRPPPPKKDDKSPGA